MRSGSCRCPRRELGQVGRVLMMVGLVLDPLAGAGESLGGEAEEGKVAQLGAVVKLQSGLWVGKLLLVKWSER